LVAILSADIFIFVKREHGAMRILILTLLCIGFSIHPVLAHPHVFITPKAVIEVNNHAVSQINMEWNFDALSSALFLEACNSNTDQIWDLIFPDTQFRADGRTVTRTNYYIYLEIDGTPVANVTPSYFKSEFVDGRLHCQFTIYVNQYVNHNMRMWFWDRSGYDAFDVKQENFSASDQQLNCTVEESQNEHGIEIDNVYLRFE
jgi:ABC-type uncharacterized transport system substrate-binding protein